MTADVTTVPTAEANGDATTMDTTAIKTIAMNAGSYYYSVKDFTVKKGQKVKIIMMSKDMIHDLNIDELNVYLPITKAGETNSVEFTADKVRTFQYYCSVGEH